MTKVILKTDCSFLVLFEIPLVILLSKSSRDDRVQMCFYLQKSTVRMYINASKGRSGVGEPTRTQHHAARERTRGQGPAVPVSALPQEAE